MSKPLDIVFLFGEFDPFIVVVHGNGKLLFGHFLTDYILIQEGFNIGRFEISGRRGVSIKDVFFFN